MSASSVRTLVHCAVKCRRPPDLKTVSYLLGLQHAIYLCLYIFEAFEHLFQNGLKWRGLSQLGEKCSFESCLLTSKQLSVAKSFAMAQSEATFGWFESNAIAAFRTKALEATNFVAIWAILNWLCWKFAKGWPNCFRTFKWSLTYNEFITCFQEFYIPNLWFFFHETFFAFFFRAAKCLFFTLF